MKRPSSPRPSSAPTPSATTSLPAPPETIQKLQPPTRAPFLHHLRAIILPGPPKPTTTTTMKRLATPRPSTARLQSAQTPTTPLRSKRSTFQTFRALTTFLLRAATNPRPIYSTKATSMTMTMMTITAFVTTTTAKFLLPPAQNPPGSDISMTQTSQLPPLMFPLQKGCVFRRKNNLRSVTKPANSFVKMEGIKSISWDLRRHTRPKRKSEKPQAHQDAQNKP